jgi:hypothetical protein
MNEPLEEAVDDFIINLKIEAYGTVTNPEPDDEEGEAA